MAFSLELAALVQSNLLAWAAAENARNPSSKARRALEQNKVGGMGRFHSLSAPVCRDKREKALVLVWLARHKSSRKRKVMLILKEQNMTDPSPPPSREIYLSQT